MKYRSAIMLRTCLKNCFGVKPGRTVRNQRPTFGGKYVRVGNALRERFFLKVVTEASFGEGICGYIPIFKIV